MIHLLHALILGVVQGATEFLPVSSSGHLTLAQHYLGVEQPSLFFEVLLHIGTLVAVLVFYRAEIYKVVLDIFKGIKRLGMGEGLQPTLQLEGIRIAIFVVLASIPTAIIGFSLKDLLDPASGSTFVSPRFVGTMLILNGVMLYGYRWLDRSKSLEKKGFQLWGLTPKGAGLIGIAQGIAILPGISRSGTTISSALLMGIRREDAAKFSFLISIPAIVGAFLLKLRELDLESIGSAEWLNYAVGAISAAVVGFLCLKWLVNLLKATKFYRFSYYCWGVGLLAVVLSFIE